MNEGISAATVNLVALYGATTLYAIALIAYSVAMARIADARTTDPSVKAFDAAQWKGRAAGIAQSTTFMGLVLHGIGVAARGVDAGHVPWSTLYEYMISGSFVVVAVFLIVQRFSEIRYVGAAVVGVATLVLGLAVTVFYREATGLQPALESFWLIIHVSIATTATGVLTVGVVVAVTQLLREFRELGSPALAKPRWQVLDTLPTPTRLEALSFRLNAVGFVLWTFTVIAGAIWAEHAWGRYWGWDPKEVWSFVIWVIYAAYLHARTTQGWTGRRAAYLVIAGYTAIILNFTAVNFLFAGKHSYAQQ